MSKGRTLQDYVARQASYSKNNPLSALHGSIRFASSRAFQLSDDEILGLLQEVQKDIKFTDGDNHVEDGSKPSKGSILLENMPLSPLMHPNLINARKRHTAGKPLPSKERTEFQTLLEKNPFANILATPVRQCALSSIRLPSFFLDSFTLRTDPRTGAPWYTPQNLEPKKEELESAKVHRKSGTGRKTAKQSSSIPDPAVIRNETSVSSEEVPRTLQDENSLEQPVEQGFPSLEAALHYMPDRSIMQQYASMKRHQKSSNLSEPPNSTGQPSYQPFSSSSHMISQMSAYQHLSNLSQRKLSQIIPRRWKDASSSYPNFNITKDFVWRTDMDEFAQDLIRRRVVYHLQEMTNVDRSGSYVKVSRDYSKLGEFHQAGAVLWVGRRSEALPRAAVPKKSETESEVEGNRSEGGAIAEGEIEESRLEEIEAEREGSGAKMEESEAETMEVGKIELEKSEGEEIGAEGIDKEDCHLAESRIENSKAEEDGMERREIEDSGTKESEAEKTEIRKGEVKRTEPEENEEERHPAESATEDSKPGQPLDWLSVPPPPYATVPYRGRQIPLFNLCTLLGEKHLSSLRYQGNQENPWSQPLYVIKNKNHTTKAIMWLWKLMGYLGERERDGVLRNRAVKKARAKIREEAMSARKEENRMSVKREEAAKVKRKEENKVPINLVPGLVIRNMTGVRRAKRVLSQ